MVAHNAMQVPMGCLSTGYIAALFSSKHSACPERVTDDPGRNIRADFAGDRQGEM